MICSLLYVGHHLARPAQLVAIGQIVGTKVVAMQINDRILHAIT
jgi:hypothetical protein